MTFSGTQPKAADSDNVLLAKILQSLNSGGGGGGGGSQTPWTSNINGNNKNLSNVNIITANSFIGALTGNASTATALQTARTINGVSFDGTANITIPAGSQTPWTSAINGGGFTLTNASFGSGITFETVGFDGEPTFNDNVTFAANVVVGGGGNLTLSGATADRVCYFNASKQVSASGVTTTELGYLSGVSSAIQTQLGAKLNLSGGQLTGNLTFSADNTLDIGANGATRPRTGYFGTSVVSPLFTGALSGNASTATVLQTGRTINGTSFNGSSNITITADAGTLTGSTLAAGVTGSSLTSVGTLSSLVVSGNTTCATLRVDDEATPPSGSGANANSGSYGGTNNVLGDPLGWLEINVNGNPVAIPYYSPGT